jgi:hypothetical protein
MVIFVLKYVDIEKILMSYRNDKMYKKRVIFLRPLDYGKSSGDTAESYEIFIGVLWRRYPLLLHCNSYSVQPVAIGFPIGSSLCRRCCLLMQICWEIVPVMLTDIFLARECVTIRMVLIW